MPKQQKNILVIRLSAMGDVAMVVPVLRALIKGEHKGVFGLYKLSRALNKKQFQVVADLHHVLRSKVLKKFIKCERFIAVDNYWG